MVRVTLDKRCRRKPSLSRAHIADVYTDGPGDWGEWESIWCGIGMGLLCDRLSIMNFRWSFTL